MTTAVDRFTPSLLQKLRITALRVLFVLLLVPILWLNSSWTDTPMIGSLLHTAGIMCVFAAVLGRFWSILYIGGHKNEGVFQDGPYSICRHPLYLFSTIGALGLGLMLESVVLAVLTGGVTYLVLANTARHEEHNLRVHFGPAYDDYATRVPRLWPSLRQFHTAPFVIFNVTQLRRNFADAMVFLGFIPLAQVILALHAHGLFAGLRAFWRNGIFGCLKKRWPAAS